MKKALPSGMLRRKADTHHRLLWVNLRRSAGYRSLTSTAGQNRKLGLVKWLPGSGRSRHAIG